MRKILVIDDDTGVLELVEEILNYEGYQVVPLTFCQDILLTISQYDPALIIMDYFLNGINGGALCQLIKQTDATAHLPVLLYSAYPDIKRDLDHFGCDAFLAKPFDITELTQTVSTLLQMNADFLI
ncbi:MAG: response regulator [Sphingobacteriaceae bacterium]|nr:MAG: response regulator [Sphingobacteriaceae bacterium]